MLLPCGRPARTARHVVWCRTRRRAPTRRRSSTSACSPRPRWRCSSCRARSPAAWRHSAARALQNALRSRAMHYTPELAAVHPGGRGAAATTTRTCIGTYLVQLSSPHHEPRARARRPPELLKAIGDFERISDHAVNVLESAEELREKGLAFSAMHARREQYGVLAAAVRSRSCTIVARRLCSRRQARPLARQVEPLEEVIDGLKEQLRTRHILRMQQRSSAASRRASSSSDLLTDLERTSDHCSNIAGCVHRRGAPRPEPPRHAAHRPPRGRGFPNPLRRRRGEVPSPRPGGVKRIPFTPQKRGQPLFCG